jgi:hypothetical protein
MKSYCPAVGNETITFSFPTAVTALVRGCGIECDRNCYSGVNTNYKRHECKANTPLEQVATVDLLKKIPSPLRNPRVRGGVSNYPQLEYSLNHIKPFPITPIITVYEETFNIIGTSTSLFCNKSFYIIILLFGPANVWCTCHKMADEKISLSRGIRCSLILLPLLSHQRPYIVNCMCMYMCTYPTACSL